MKILISGGTGLVGTALATELRSRGHDVNILVRKKSPLPHHFLWNYEEDYLEDGALNGVESIIHLAGASIGKRWTPRYKKELKDSRIKSAAFLHQQCRLQNLQLKSFISASGINYYGTFTTEEILTEEMPARRNDFLAEVCTKWENAVHQFKDSAERIVILRTAPVLSARGGTLEPLQKIARLNLSSAIGKGTQWFNWIHLQDMVNMYVQAVEQPQFNGIYNAVADDIPNNRDFMKALAHSMNKWFLPVSIPAVVMKTILGEMSEIILEGSRISNEKVKAAGFRFQYPDLEPALRQLMQ
ncbi:TIGR01777 family oxidoreductase [Chryseobacterium sp. MFBS3-17]|uniref:TIGR01777 family oxidoreductase n=1 Tax=Chryseobacterium sp. MFBS3-17 TaxID=2886689 RepID=UPI001D0DCEE2|nr:TIGR01777 family oxidoreductase [Chryseobacterium sp. MFBS3-17]MCC2590115.1 TIGR01777 family oxidoreductase [Chryseobacterium sp. MFBS3-17]